MLASRGMFIEGEWAGNRHPFSVCYRTSLPGHFVCFRGVLRAEPSGVDGLTGLRKGQSEGLLSAVWEKIQGLRAPLLIKDQLEIQRGAQSVARSAAATSRHQSGL